MPSICGTSSCSPVVSKTLRATALNPLAQVPSLVPDEQFGDLVREAPDQTGRAAAVGGDRPLESPAGAGHQSTSALAMGSRRPAKHGGAARQGRPFSPVAPLRSPQMNAERSIESGSFAEHIGHGTHPGCVPHLIAK